VSCRRLSTVPIIAVERISPRNKRGIRTNDGSCVAPVGDLLKVRRTHEYRFVVENSQSNRKAVNIGDDKQIKILCLQSSLDVRGVVTLGREVVQYPFWDDQLCLGSCTDDRIADVSRSSRNCRKKPLEAIQIRTD
jgi:hypothetical protein